MHSLFFWLVLSYDTKNVTMSKSTFFTGQPIFAQLLSYVSHHKINQIAIGFKSDRYYKGFYTYEHLVTMLYCIFNRCTSLREVVTGLQAWEQRVKHLGINSHPRKSTISDANSKRNSAVFEAIYLHLYEKYRYFLPDSRVKKSAKRFFIADSTTISLFQEILNGVGTRSVDGKRKGGIKVHTLMRSDEDVPCLVRMASGASSDNLFLDHITLPEGSILVMDRGYSYDYKRLSRLTKRKITWVSRIRKQSVYRIVAEREVLESQRKKGVLKDTQIILGHTAHKNITHVKARLVVYKDPKSKEVFEFITNNLRFAPFTIAEFYRKRWQIELLFKRIKQNYPLKNFLGDSENAIRIQVWCALIADLLIKLVKANAGRKWSFSNLSSMIRLHLMTYIELYAFLKNPEKALMRRNKNHIQQTLFTQPVGLGP